MRKGEALAIARREVSQVYRVAAGRGGETWGFSVEIGDQRGMRSQNAIGTYREAVQARIQWLRDRVAVLLD